MDAYSGYNQIRMFAPDEEKIAFVTDRGMYCYRVMPFALKNAETTYRRFVNTVFSSQLGKNMEVYVDDMLTNSLDATEHCSDLRETFQVIRKYGMRLNPKYCAFGVSSGKFLGFMVNYRGIQANPDKIKVIWELRSLRTTKKIQKLAGWIVAFVSRMTDRCLLFFRALKKSSYNQWDGDC
ncbi:hypothetical protein ACOSQ4_005381 [Xanthoceras sorbifolium]